jgi:outer membrane protein OmpA-like peptidoglycan-associated protein
VAYLVKAPRVGRSQGAVIFWGLVSAFFASAFCYYYLENRTNEERNRSLVDQVMVLQSEREALSSERNKMEAEASDTEKQLHDREEFLQDKETKLAQEESDIESMGTQTLTQSQLSAAQAAGVKKFDDTVRKIVAKFPGADVVVRGGRPVLRVPSLIFFDPANSDLKPDGKTVLDQVAEAAGGPSSHFELRLETFTDSAGEKPAAAAAATPNGKPADAVDAWSLTGQRAAALAHYLRDQGPLPFQDIITVGRADFQPLVPDSQPGHERNRRVEITITPTPATFHAPEATAKTSHGKTGTAAAPGTSADTGGTP